MKRRIAAVGLALFVSSLAACGDSDQTQKQALEEETIYNFANECYTVAATSGGDSTTFLKKTDGGESFAFEAGEAEAATRFYFKPSDLGEYLLYGEGEQYLMAREGSFVRRAEFSSDIFELDDSFLPGAQWRLEISARDERRYQMRHVKSEQYLGNSGLVDEENEAAVLKIASAEGCTPHPELSLDAEGQVEKTTFENGDLWGFVETHSHIMTNLSFGGAGMFHGAPFDPFGVEHALPSCEKFHGEQGRKDLFGYGFNNVEEVSQEDLIDAILEGKTPEPNHATSGYPEFEDWPNAHFSPTHQTQYYKWIKRAYMGGLRLMVQHATSNEMICQLLAGSDVQPTRYSCNDMVAVDRIIKRTKKMRDYIDAQSGGPGEGWFRIVRTPEEAREVIEEGKLAIILGIEVSNLFDCYLVPPEGKERCTKEDVVERLESYHERGVRALFPVHKFDNAFSAGDGHRGVIELGNFAQTGHFSSFVKDCPDVPVVYDRGDVQFGALNKPRDDYDAEPPVDASSFGEEPVNFLLEHSSDVLGGGKLEGDYCQKHGLTDLGEFLIRELMKRGMIIEVDHLSQRSYQRAFEMLEANDYPAVGSHGSNNDGKIYELGGVSKFNFDSCAEQGARGTRDDALQERISMLEEAGQYPAEGFGFDLNGFAGAPGPRFGDRSVCDAPQKNPVEYPFESYSGNVTFTQPKVGERTVDFNTQGFVHIGMMPELIKDVRNTGVSREDLKPLFRSAEGYLRMWEKARERAEEIGDE